MQDLKLNSHGSFATDVKEENVKTPGRWFALLYFFWLGGVALIPWASIVNSLDYFEAKFPNDSVSFVFPIAPYIANLILLGMITHLSKIISYKVRIIIGIVVQIALEVVIPFEANGMADSEFGFWLVIGLLLLMGFFGNMCYASICGFTSQLGTSYTVAFMLGVAAFGLVMNLTKEGTLLIFNNGDAGDINSILLYFGITIIFLLIGLAMHVIFMKSRFYRIELKRIVSNHKSVSDSSYSSLLQQPPVVKPKKNFKTLFRVFLDGWFLISLMCVSNLQHNTFYPGVMLLKQMPTMEATTKTVSLVTTFNVFYIIGKLIAQFRSRYGVRVVVGVVLFRFTVDALFILQVVEPNAPVLGSYWIAYVNVAVAATTLGFLICALFIMIPEQFTSEKKELAGFVAVIGNNFGTMIGSFLALTLTHLSP